MQLEELKEFKNHVRAEENLPRKNDRDHDMHRSREGPGNSKFAKYTPLNTGQVHILEEALSTELILTPHKFPLLPMLIRTNTVAIITITTTTPNNVWP